MFYSASSDRTARIWTISGRYIGTLGSPLKWKRLDPTKPVGADYPFRYPPDIKRVGSSTTMKVGRVVNPTCLYVLIMGIHGLERFCAEETSKIQWLQWCLQLVDVPESWRMRCMMVRRFGSMVNRLKNPYSAIISSCLRVKKCDPGPRCPMHCLA